MSQETQVISRLKEMIPHVSLGKVLSPSASLFGTGFLGLSALAVLASALSAQLMLALQSAPFLPCPEEAEK